MSYATRHAALSEPLEGRVLLSTIQWVNRGEDSDRFDATFGADAAAARAVVDAALDRWERTIADFNYADGTNTYRLLVAMRSEGTGFSAIAGPDPEGFIGDKPAAGTMVIARGSDTGNDGDGDGDGWFLDPTPDDDSEFTGSLLNAYAGGLRDDYPTDDTADLLTVCMHEMGHALGIYANDSTDDFDSDTGVPDPASGGVANFWAFDGPSVRHLFSGYDTGGGGNPADREGTQHAAQAGVSVDFNGVNYRGSTALMNATFASSQRKTVGLVDALVLRDAFGYTVNDPETFGTFYSVLDESTGQVLIRGSQDPGGSDDQITVFISGGVVTVAVDIGNDVPGTGHLPGVGNLNAFVTTYSTAEVSGILIQAGDGDDTINVNALDAGTPVTALGESGDDTFNVGGGDLDFNINPNLSLNGGTGADAVHFHDSNDDPGGDQYTLGTTTLLKPGAGVMSWALMEGVTLNASTHDDEITVTGTLPNTPVTVNGNLGDETLIWGAGDIDSNFAARVSFFGQGGGDAIEISDASDGGADSYTFTATTFGKSNTAPDLLTFDATTEFCDFIANGGANVVNLNASDFANLSVHGGPGNDTFNVGGPGGGDIDSNLAGVDVFVDGGANADTLNLNDGGDSAGNDSYSLTDDNSFTKTSYGAVLTYAAVEGITLNANGLNNAIDVRDLPAATPLTVNGGGGDDAVTLGDGDVGNVAAAVTVNGQAGADTVTIDDVDFAGGTGHTITPTGVSRANFGGLNYATIEGLTVNAHDVGATTIVQGTAAGTPVTVNANGGADTFAVGTLAAGVANIQSLLTLNGGLGADEAVLNDFVDPTGDSVTVTSTRVGTAPGNNYFGPGGGVAYTGVANLTVNLGGGGDLVRVVPSAVTAFTINAGNPAPPTTSGDELRLNLAGVNGTAFAPGAPGAGQYTFANRQPVSFAGIERTSTAVTVDARLVFYNRSAFDGNNAAANAADDGAIAPDKTALLPGGTATFANYTSYTRGINGIVIDVFGLPAGAAPTAANDFRFRVGNDDNPAAWAAAPAPSAVTVRAGAGAGGSDRVTLTWPDGAILDTWLQVTVRSTANTGLAGDDVFYFGNAVAESGNSAADAAVTYADELGARAHPGANVPATNRWDYNRDGHVNVTDQLIARSARTGRGAELDLINVPRSGAVRGSSSFVPPVRAGMLPAGSFDVQHRRTDHDDDDEE